MPTPRGLFADFPWRSWGAACAITLLLLEAAKLMWMFSAGPAPLDGDAGLYWKLGEQVAAGDIWMRADPVGFRTPGYPWLLGLMQRFCGQNAWWCVLVMQHVAVWITTLLTGWWTFQLTGSVRLSNVAILVRLISIANAAYASTVLTESVFEPIFMLLLMALTVSPMQQTDRRWWWIGGLFAGAFLLRPAVAGIAPAVMIAALGSWPLSRTIIRDETPRRLGIVVAMALLLIGPWCVRNGFVFGRPVPVIFLGREMWVSVFGPGSPTGPALPQTPEADRIQQATGELVPDDAWRGNWAVSTALTQSGLNDAETDGLMLKVAGQGLRRDPGRWMARCLWRTADFWRTIFSKDQFFSNSTASLHVSTAKDQSVWGSEPKRLRRTELLAATPENRLLIIELGSLFGLLGAMGVLLHPRMSHRGWIIMTALLAIGAMSAILEQPNYRYRMVLEPILIVGALVGMQVWQDMIQRGRDALQNE